MAGPTHRARVGLTGQWSAASGRGEDLRCTAHSLQAAGYTDFLIIDRDSGAILRPDGTALPAGPVELETNIVHLNADTAYDDWQFLQRRRIAARRSIGYWAWELDRLPQRWLHAYSFYDEIWAATEFARGAFAAPALRPVRLVPLAVLPPPVPSSGITRGAERTRLGLPEQATVFFFMFDFRSYASRKNPEAVVQAFLRAFPRGGEAVRLLIKTQGGASAAGPWRKLNALCRDPRIEIRDVALERAELLALIDTADAFVSLHRSEGFGRGPAEAMLMGKPVIVTDYSGTTDFAAADGAFLVGYTLRPVAEDEYPGVDGQEWADADIEQAAAHMRHIHADPAAARAVGERGRAAVAARHDPAVIGPQILAALGLAPEESGRVIRLPPRKPAAKRRLAPLGERK